MISRFKKDELIAIATSEQAKTFILAWICIATLMRGYAPVNNWSISNWLITYDLGFIKRGLWGTFFHPFISLAESHGTSIESAVTIAGLLIILAFMITLLFITREIMQNAANNAWPFLLASSLFASPAISMMANITGYYDYIVYLLGVAAILATTRNRNWLSGLLLSAAVLTHEISIVYLTPIMTLCLFCIHIQKKEAPQTKHYFKTTRYDKVFNLTAPLVVMIFVFFYQNQFVDSETYKQNLHTTIFNSIKIPEEAARYFTDLLTHSFIDYLKEELPEFTNRITDTTYTSSILPLLIFLIFGIWNSLKCEFKNKITILLLSSACMLAPLTLHAVAFDTERFWTMPILSGILVLWILIKTGTIKILSPSGFLAQAYLALTVYYIMLRPFGMVDTAISLVPSDIALLYGIPVLYLCWFSGRNITDQPVNTRSHSLATGDQ
jgi:hypothetical protein